MGWPRWRRFNWSSGPLAFVPAVGHALSENHHSRVAQGLGAALDEA